MRPGDERQGHEASHDGSKARWQANRDAAQCAAGHHGQANGIQQRVITNARQSAFLPVLQSPAMLQSPVDTGVLDQQMPELQSELKMMLQEMSKNIQQEMSKDIQEKLLQRGNRQAQMSKQSENRQARYLFAVPLLHRLNVLQVLISRVE